MNIDFSTRLVEFDCNSGSDEKTVTASFPFDVQSAEVCLKGFALDYEHSHESHIASIQIGTPSINGYKVSCPVSVETPKNSPVITRNANVLFIATGR